MFADIAWYPEQGSTTATEVDRLFYFLTGVCGAVGLLVAVLIIYFSIRYRRRPGQFATCGSRLIIFSNPESKKNRARKTRAQGGSVKSSQC